jgi:UTP--glucose-1-phosphate uridylyltransferase
MIDVHGGHGQGDTAPCAGLLAVVTAAGGGTRFQPFSAIVPKEMLPLGTMPALGHVIEECVQAGVDRVVVVTRPGDQVIPAPVATLRADGLSISTVAEDRAHGYGNAVPLLTLADQLSGASMFVVAFGDDVLLSHHEAETGCDLAAICATAGRGADAAIAAQVVDRAEIGSFGVLDLVPEEPERVAGIRQRPDLATVSEPLAIVSRLILRPSILALLVASDQARGEVDLGVAVGRLAGTPTYAFTAWPRHG